MKAPVPVFLNPNGDVGLDRVDDVCRLDARFSEKAMMNAERNTSICGSRSADLRQNVLLCHGGDGVLAKWCSVFSARRSSHCKASPAWGNALAGASNPID